MGHYNQLFTEVEVRTMPPKELIEAYLALANEYIRLQQTAVDLVHLNQANLTMIVERLEKAGHLDDIKDLLQRPHTN